LPYKNDRQTALIESTVFAVHLSKPLGHLDLAFLLRVTGNRHDSFRFWDYRKLIGLNFLVGRIARKNPLFLAGSVLLWTVLD
jgi:hypothetical protein